VGALDIIQYSDYMATILRDGFTHLTGVKWLLIGHLPGLASIDELQRGIPDDLGITHFLGPTNHSYRHLACSL